MSDIDAYDPEAFRAAGHRLIDGLADHLVRAGGRDCPAISNVAPERMLEELPARFPAGPGGDVVMRLLEVVRRSTAVHHPGYVGHQVSTPLPQAALAELTSALINNGMAIYEMGQMQTVMERHVVAWMCGVLGFGDGSGGILTHGGSLGNLTALLAARQARAGHDIWTEGTQQPLALLASDQAHYCIDRAARIMGWGAGGSIAVPTDGRFRMGIDELERSHRRAVDEGRRVVAVVASCCSTATGSFDPVDAIADFCAEHDLWLHVDGAHGASFALSERTRDRLRGVERADSVVWDLHKMMALPSLNTAVLFRDGRRSYEAFAQQASYLFDDTDPGSEWFNVGRRTMECTKRALGVTAYCMLEAYGTAHFARHVERLMELTHRLEALVVAAADFELAVEPEANILCFRHVPPGFDQDLDGLQARIRRRVLDNGRYYLVQTRLRGRLWLRTSLMNPNTTEDDLEGLLDEIRATAANRGHRLD
ncbi:pyridoxal phosphate-dependent decarboxylase family protein [Engelhardtia mirabilis]|uniref:L-2,4-diaminobutyrate decarboxylase n=1 Tax=Engelhardtia mirabilis TaxID=2528011 RepID=A0A518BEF8_9BACT|nr:L-2,4-diaminobutyrate decarboxylase [Planctomycetes bacterium Pla133]QDU99701.1 L-2,4-diaminobutyrate decarboxylase [Planctomycetes bacterium Pla86]